MARDVNETGRATVDASGTATVIVRGPHRTLTRWQLVTVTIQSTRVGDGTYPTAKVYRSLVADAAVIGTSRAADAVTFDASGDWLLPGDQLVVVVEGASPGTLATVNLFARELP